MSSIKPTIYLIKDNITETKQIFKKPRSLTLIELGGAQLYYRKSKKSTPDWAYFLDENFATTTAPFSNSSSYAVLIIEIDNRWLAIPFGMGGHLIDMTKMEYNFGLKTAINCVPKSQIRQIDTTTPEVNSQKTKKQAVLGSTPEDLGINKQKDILRGMVGKLSKNHELGEALEGKDSLRLNKGIESLIKLKTLCKNVLKYYKSNNYKNDYPWIDNIALIRDKSLLDQLTIKLVKSLKQGMFENMFFTPPVYYEHIFDCNGFVFSSNDGTRLKKKDSYEMPSMEDWKKSVGKARKDIKPENLDNFKVNLIGEDDHKHSDWPLQKCLAWEVTISNNKYILSEGSWYAVAPDFFQEVNNFYLARLTNIGYPAPSKNKIRECDYNKELADSHKDKYLFDLGHNDSKDKGIGKDFNEVCDVYDALNKCFIHIKMGKTSSAISHLIRQGAFSGLMLKQDELHRKQFIQHLLNYGCTNNVITEPYSPVDYSIVFGLVIGKKQKQDIPFFSKVTFKNTLENSLELMGYNCSIGFILTPG